MTDQKTQNHDVARSLSNGGLGCLPDVEHGLCNPNCPHLDKWKHPFWHNTAWCWHMMKDLSWYDYWIADCIDGKPDKKMIKIKECGRTDPPNVKVRG